MTPAPLTWRISPTLALTLDRPRILAIINTTPDSFSDAGLHLDPADATQRIHQAIAEGAAILDVGGESTRPGASPVPDEEQIARTIPVIRRARAEGVVAPISIDTTSAGVARAALDAGADIINDQSAAQADPAMLPLAAERACGLILMHRARPPAHDRWSTEYADDRALDAHPPAEPPIVARVRDALRERLDAAARAGIHPYATVIDPGLGFGKSVAQNYQLIAHAASFTALARPLLSAASRKSFIGAASGVDDPPARVAGTLAVSLAHFAQGVRLFRVHDVAPHAQALATAQTIAAARPRGAS